MRPLGLAGTDDMAVTLKRSHAQAEGEVTRLRAHLLTWRGGKQVEGFIKAARVACRYKRRGD